MEVKFTLKPNCPFAPHCSVASTVGGAGACSHGSGESDSAAIPVTLRFLIPSNLVWDSDGSCEIMPLHNGLPYREK
jgi:hypothetical protein